MLNSGGQSVRDELLERALSLDPHDRAYLAEALEESLRPADFESPEIGEAWSLEIERRAVALEKGDMPTDEWRQVISRLRNNASQASRPEK
jgi:hypothetical protein